jgi:hypothetical protein
MVSCCLGVLGGRLQGFCLQQTLITGLAGKALQLHIMRVSRWGCDCCHSLALMISMVWVGTAANSLVRTAPGCGHLVPGIGTDYCLYCFVAIQQLC